MKDVGCDFAAMQDYIVGRLSDGQRQAFEERLVREPGLVTEFEHYLRMREGLQRLKTQGYFAKAAPRRSSRLWSPALAAAAGAGLALFLWTQQSVAPPAVLMATLGSHTATALAPFVAARFTFVSVRGGLAPDLDLPTAGVIELRAAPATRVAASHYRVSLVRQAPQGSQRLGALAGLVLGGDGYVHTYADAARLAPGGYVLRIEPDSRSPGMAESFQFTLRAPVNGASP